MKVTSLDKLAKKITKCTLCVDSLPMGARPVLQVSTQAKILIAGQAPGIRVHRSGIPFDDPSGKRLRAWMGISDDTFYNPNEIAILPMGFCYPGTGKSGDLPPRPECAKEWRQQVLDAMPQIELILVIGMYALKWHMPDSKKRNLTQTVKAWEEYWPELLPIPHPSPRNNIWLKKNQWFEKEVVPELQTRIKRLLK